MNFEIHDYRFLKKFSEYNMDVHAISLSNKKINKEEIVDGIKYYEYADYFPDHSFLKKFPPFWFLMALFFLRSIVNQIKPDIVHSGYVTIVGFLAALLKKAPLLIMPWGSDILIEPKQSYFKRKIAQYTLESADRICCDCQIVKSTILKISNVESEKVIVFPWGIDLSKFKPSNNKSFRSNSPITVISTRKFEKIYAVENLIHAIPMIVKINPNFRFKIIGGGTFFNKFENYINENNISEYVELLSFVKNDDLISHLDTSNIYVSTSSSDGTSLSLLEAMAMGLPLLVSDIPANREWVKTGYNGILLDSPISPTKLAQDIIQLGQDLDKISLMSQRNLLFSSKKADWNKNFQVLIDCYLGINN